MRINNTEIHIEEAANYKSDWLKLPRDKDVDQHPIRQMDMQSIDILTQLGKNASINDSRDNDNKQKLLGSLVMLLHGLTLADNIGFNLFMRSESSQHYTYTINSHHSLRYILKNNIQASVLQSGAQIALCLEKVEIQDLGYEWVFILESDGALTLQYDARYYTNNQINHILNMFRSLISINFDQLVGCLSLYTGEKLSLSARIEKTTRKYSRQQRIEDHFIQQVNQQPDAIALVLGKSRWSYKQLYSRTLTIAHYLQIQSQTGFDASNSRVVIMLDRTLDMVAAIFGSLIAGYSYIPIVPSYPTGRISAILEDADAEFVLTNVKYIDKVLGTRVLCVEDIPDNGVLNKITASRILEDAEEKINDIAYIIYTSGTSGKPKGVQVSHSNVLNLISWALQSFSKSELRGSLASTAICFDVSIWEMFVALSAGEKLILANSIVMLPTVRAKNEITFITTVPSALVSLLDCNAIPKNVQVIALAGEPLTRRLSDRIYKETDVIKVYDLYGPTEDTVYSTACLRRKGEVENIGYPIAGGKAWIVNKKNYVLEDGFIGELVVGGEGVSLGYLNLNRLNAEKFHVSCVSDRGKMNVYRTGDLARCLVDGRIQYVGRIDHQVKHKGFRIELSEIERQIEIIDGVGMCVVLLRDKPDLNSNLVISTELIAIIKMKNLDNIPQKIIHQKLKDKLPNYMLPNHYYFIDNMPYNHNGKLDRHALLSTVLDYCSVSAESNID